MSVQQDNTTPAYMVSTTEHHNEIPLTERVWLSPAESAKYLSVSRDWIYRRLQDGSLLGYRVGQVRRIRRMDLDDLFLSEGGRRGG